LSSKILVKNVGPDENDRESVPKRKLTFLKKRKGCSNAVRCVWKLHELSTNRTEAIT